MWLLSCDGDVFGGKTHWLRPGTTHLLGRTTGKAENGERLSYIEEKTVSRKHLTINVLPVAPGSSLKLYERSKVELKDASRSGTWVNDEKFSQDTKVLGGGGNGSTTEYKLKLGQCKFFFHLVWRPVVLSYSSSSKKEKDPFQAQRAVLEGADLKALKGYVSNETTHTIGKKRNTASNLQALVQARWLVGEDFVTALSEAITAGSGDDGSLLEVDFDGNWPDEGKYIVASGNEPVQREDQFYFPDPQRGEVFSDCSFVFLDRGQYESLLPVITSGSGKALLWEYDPAESKLDAAVEYIKTVAGLKDARSSRLTQSSGSGGVVTVRPNAREDGSSRAVRDFVKAMDVAVCQRSIEQNELLDVILTMDTSSLRQPLEEAPEEVPPVNGQQPSPAPSQRQSQRAISVNESPPAQPDPPQNEQPPTEEQGPQGQEEPPTTAPRKRQRRYITQSRFKGFDDVDPSQFSKPASQSPAPATQQREASQAPSLQAMDVDDEPSQAPRTQNARKRAAPQVDELDEEAWMDKMLPGQAAMKRQKTEAALRNGDKDAVVAKYVAAEKAQVKKRKAKEMDVMADLKARREREEEASRKDEESLREAMDGVDLSELKNLAKVEEMEVPVRERPVRGGGQNGRGERWDDAWNGRKNFKKFRPHGSTQNGPRLQRVIVALEEVPRKGHGIGDDYWLQPSRTSKKSKSRSQSQSIRQAASSRTDDINEDPLSLRRQIQRSREEDEDQAHMHDVHPAEIAGRARDEALQAAAQGSPSQTLRSESQRKRPAASGSAGAPPAKRARQSRIPTGREVVDLDEEEDDGDELKFRRRRR